MHERTCETSKSSRKRRKEYWSALNLRLSAASVHRVHCVVNVSTISNGVPSVYARARPPGGQTCLVRLVPRVPRMFERKFTRWISRDISSNAIWIGSSELDAVLVRIFLAFEFHPSIDFTWASFADPRIFYLITLWSSTQIRERTNFILLLFDHPR